MKQNYLRIVFICFAQLIFIGQIGFAQHRISLSQPKDIIITGVGGTLFLGGYYFYQKKDPLSVEQISNLKISDINSFDRSATKNYSVGAADASDILLYSSMALPALLMADKDIRKDIAPVMLVYLQSVLFTSGEVLMMKGLVDRTRPFVYNENAPMSEKQKADANASFFSSHTALTANATAYTAAVYSIYRPDSKALPYIYVAAAAIPLTTGYLRYEAGKHFPTDIAAGLIIGALNGYLMAKWHKTK